MLLRLTKSFRIKAAIAVALLYALCVLAPSAALAFADSSMVAHCLTEQHGMAKPHDHGGKPHDHGGKTHVHDDGTAHHHGDHGATANDSEADKQGHSGSCCGLFCMSALAAEAVAALGDPLPFSLLVPAVSRDLAGRGPDRINRPPIA
jgi:hypothetical protein